MKQEVIDGSVPNAGVTLYEVPELGSDLAIDFIEASDLEQIEQGIREIQSTTDLLALVQGIAVLKIEREGLWMQAGYHSLNEYRIAQNQRLGMPRQTLSRRRMVAEGYLDNRKALGAFPLHGHVEKLGLLNQAVKQYGKRDAISHFKKDTYKAFSEWIKPRQLTEDLTDVEIRLVSGGIEIGGEPVLLWPEDYPEPDRKWLGSVVERAYQARAGGNQALVLSVYDDGEARAVELFLKRHRAGK